jgi:indole-3-glycerol phosphate synthase
MKQKEREVAHKRTVLPLDDLKRRMDGSPIRDLRDALSGGEQIIAEVKKRSPKIEVFRQTVFAQDLASVYEQNGAAAVSVVTDETYFGMSLADAKRIRSQIAVPVLVKDFFFDPYQIHEARVFGADAVLLISRILANDDLKALLTLTHELGMRALVEVHSQDDLVKAQDAGAGIIGINNRDLDSLEVSLDTTRDLIDQVGDDVVAVSESGIHTRSDIRELTARGVDAFLIGGALLESKDPGRLLRTLLGRVVSEQEPN